MALRHLCGFRLYFFRYRQWSYSQELYLILRSCFQLIIQPLWLNSCSLTCLRTSCWASLKHTALIQLKLPSRSLSTGTSAPAGMTFYRRGNWGTGFVPFSLAELLLPMLPFPVSPGKAELWTQILLPQGLDNVADWICACCFTFWVFLLKLFPGCWQAPGFQELSPVFPSENRGSGGIPKNTNSQQTRGFQNWIWLSKAFSRRVDLGQN